MATRAERADRTSRYALRVAIATLSGLVLFWSLGIFSKPELMGEHENLIWQKLFGETFTPEQVAQIRTPCDNYHRNIHPRAALLAALIAVRDAELSLADGEAKDFKELAQCAGAASRQLIQSNASSSIGWFLLAWTERLIGADPDVAARYLARSVALAPRELWMAIKRVPLMQVEILRGNLALARGDYRVLAEGERYELAATLLGDCVARDPICEMDWNAGLNDRQVKLVWDERIRRSN
ncbi:hypothetical protein [Bosea sp. 124]|uniref:hypothetical protein n=1 Tax=Bosea sp. 124 TaxID=2135642 RepID=UPI000D47CE41|nr:hypothetical protein [Bosea sp. 124]PTM41730.1 hypothetical protein C8D03_3303 [Bosea sp. 124]